MFNIPPLPHGPQDSDSKYLRTQKELKRLQKELTSKDSANSALEAEKANISTSLLKAEESLTAAKAELAKVKKGDKRENAQLEELMETKVDLEIKVKKLESDLQDEKARAKAKEKELDKERKAAKAEGKTALEGLEVRFFLLD